VTVAVDADGSWEPQSVTSVDRSDVLLCPRPRA
jgi:hypothetical protein